MSDVAHSAKTIHSREQKSRNVLLTGVTGFLGQALLERLLDNPNTTVHVLIRPRRGVSGQRRLAELLDNDAFAVWRERVGPAAVAHTLAHRLRVIEADLGADLPDLPADLDLVLHSASLVTFDEPLDSAMAVNVGGPAGLYQALLRAGGDPHVIHVSTSYVNTERTAHAYENSVEHDLDWRAELDGAARTRTQLERLSRLAEASALTGEDPMPATPAGREAWVRAQLRERGRSRAAELGWTDVYTLTKALGERVAEELWAGSGHRLTILRPTIIESALARPFPGWLDGFKVADPLIAAYAKGRLVGFPGQAESIIDIVPVDIVVDTAAAAAASPGLHGQARYFQVGTGTSNPVTLGEVRQHVMEYFAEHPYTDRQGRPISPKPWQFSTPDQLSAWSRRRRRALTLAQRSLRLAPGIRSPRARIRHSLAQLDVLDSYVQIYRSYTCASTTYDDRNTRALLAAHDPNGRNVTQIEWRSYFQEVHLPRLVALMDSYRARSKNQRQLAAVSSADNGESAIPRSRPRREINHPRTSSVERSARSA
ncbi:SDR family oxidoreductase [Gephyromycinifex aptenodytis]|uniref:SDR family oxidoreductase n=1 Tax=Gephyromycinifex aptenodytis TaxID=2716227 RepID=UPI0014465AF0|nr:SDR family oxidoreductase [Gephyromycinifex aptenodytis]